MSKWMLVVGAVVVVMLVGAGAFYGGMTYQRSRQANLQEQFFAERGGMPGGVLPSDGVGGGFAGGQFPSGNVPGMGRGAAGTVSSLEGETLLLTTNQETTTVLLTDATVVQRLVTGHRADLQPGQTVTVMGERDDQERLTAITIQILADQP
jgi:hypothetical protein